MRAMMFDKAGAPLQLRQCDAPAPGPGQILLGVRLRGLPHRPARRRWRAAQPQAAGGPGARDRRPRGGVGRGWSVSPPASVSACPGWAGPAENAPIAARGGRICAIPRASPATRSTAAMPSSPRRMPATASRSPSGFPTPRPRRCLRGLIGYRTCAPGAMRAARHLRLWGGGAYRGAGGPPGGPRFSPSPAPATRRPKFARRIRRLGRGFKQAPPEPLDAALIFAPVGALVPAALRAVAPGGVVVCGGIHMSDIPALPLRDPVDGARPAFGRQPHPTRWRGVSGAGGAAADPRRNHALPARSGQRGAGGVAGGAVGGGRGAGDGVGEQNGGRRTNPLPLP